MRLLFIFLLFQMFGNLQAQIKPAEESNKKTPPTLNLNHYQFPKSHPARKILRTLFRHPRMFDSPKELEKGGFKVKLGHKKLMVGFHPSLSGYAIKKFCNCVPLKMQLDNYIKRIEGAQVLRNYIKEQNFKRLSIPKKWLYQLPKNFEKHGDRSYVLIVEDMNIYDDWDNPQGEARQLYFSMDKNTVTELCTVLHAVGGCDAYPWNQPFAHSGKIAFIDTEHVGQRKFHDYFIRHIVPQLNEEMQAFAHALWTELQAKEVNY